MSDDSPIPPSGDQSDEFEGRHILNALGQPEIIVLERLYWDYVEWLDGQGVDIEKFFQRCDRERGDTPLQDAIAWWIYWALELREKNGESRPAWMPPPAPFCVKGLSDAEIEDRLLQDLLLKRPD